MLGPEALGRGSRFPEKADFYVHAFTSPSLVITGDQGAPAKRARDLVGRFGRGELVELRNYSSPAWADTIAGQTSPTRSVIFSKARVHHEVGEGGQVFRCQAGLIREKSRANKSLSRLANLTEGVSGSWDPAA